MWSRPFVAWGTSWVLANDQYVTKSTVQAMPGLPMTLLRALIAGLHGGVAWQTTHHGSGRLEITLLTVPAQVRL